MLSGSPAFDNRTWLRSTAAFQRLPEMLRRLNQLEKLARMNAGSERKEAGN